MKKLILSLLLFISAYAVCAQENPGHRKNIPLHGREHPWKSIVHDTDPNAYNGFETPAYDDSAWTEVSIPHNWDKYEGARQLRHGNRHGYAWYRTEFTVDPADREGKQVFLYFEGVGSYGTVWVNGKEAGYHAGGRTTFTLNITDLVKYGEDNTLAVRADHPALIADLPWVCGGCSSEWGFSEGSQPMGIFRPVTLVITGDVRIEPFGVHVWNDNDITPEEALVHFNTELKNYRNDKKSRIHLMSRITDSRGKVLATIRNMEELAPGETKELKQEYLVSDPVFWSDENPYLYFIVTEVYDIETAQVVDREITPFGIRTVSWHLNRNDGSQTFQLNGKPVLLNGVGEYEHNLGQSHAFTREQILVRASQIKQAGFNAFRDAHQPHNLLYGQIWNETGMLWWSQMSAHIWYDTPAFRENFKQLLREFIKERRNSPALIIWGLQNESMLPTDFAQECTEIFREMDPTTSSQRLVTTCNGGTGTDWNVIQNWSGTYSGDPAKYAQEMSVQILNGEYGAWRSIDWHTEGAFKQNGPLSEDRMSLLMESKIRLIESVRDSVAGQFLWIFSSHDNPGRIQNDEAWRGIDKVGPFNYKGLLTPWAEPLDAYYMYRSNYVAPHEAPMAYIVSHTWPDRWTIPGTQNSTLRVFSNCDSVALYNGMYPHKPLGARTRNGIGTHFTWENPDIQTCLLTAIGYVDGKMAAVDYVVLNHLPEPIGIENLTSLHENVTQPDGSLNYLYRVNCGGDTFVDQNGSLWIADRHRTNDTTWGSLSWADDFPGIPPYFGSQRRSYDPIWNAEWPLFQTFRFGTDKLRFDFPVPDGEYTVELYFSEPWYGREQSLNCRGWRMFDVAVNGKTVISDLDIWSFRGANTAIKQTVKAQVTGGMLTVHFPHVTSGQAIISAIAIATDNFKVKPAEPSPNLVKPTAGTWEWHSWLGTGDEQFLDDPRAFAYLPAALHTGEWLKNSGHQAPGRIVCEFSDSAYVYLIGKRNLRPRQLTFLSAYEKLADSVVNGQDEVYDVYRKTVQKGEVLQISGSDATAIANLVATPIPNMGEEPSSRPVSKFEAEELPVTGSVERGNFRNGDFVKLNETGGTIEFEVNPTLAGTYLIRFRYMNYSGEAIPMQMEILNALNGVEMMKDTIWFEPADEKWRIMSTTTGSQINAGVYKIRLTVLDKTGIEFESIEFE